MRRLLYLPISLFSLFLLFNATSAFGQTQRGVKFVGKPIYIDNLRTLSGSYISHQFISVSLYGGTFIKNDLAVGAGIKSTQSIVTLIKNPSSANSSLYGFARQYFKTPVRNLKAYGEANLGYNLMYIPGLGNGSQTGTTAENSLGLGLSPGVSYFLSNRVSADAFVSGLQVNASQIKNLQWQTVLPQLSRIGVGIAGTVYF